MAGELVDFGNRIAKITDAASLRRIVIAGGMAGKAVAFEAAASDLGGDRMFSGLGRAPLGAGFDEMGGTMIKLNYRPPGLWMLAEKGRRAGKPILPRSVSRKRGGGSARALSTPEGPRARSTTGYWGGKGTWSAAVREARVAVPKAGFKAFQLEIAKAVR